MIVSARVRKARGTEKAAPPWRPRRRGGGEQVVAGIADHPFDLGRRHALERKRPGRGAPAVIILLVREGDGAHRPLLRLIVLA